MLIVFIFQKNRSLLRAPNSLPPTIIEFCPLIFSPFFSDSKNIPLYKIVINDSDEELGVSKISTVKDPAIGVNYLAFNNTNINKSFVSLSTDQMKLAGPFLIPDLIIPRYNEIEFIQKINEIQQQQKEVFTNNSFIGATLRMTALEQLLWFG